jgi:hypothetical protein
MKPMALTLAQAAKLISEESLGEQGLVTQVRMGDDPDRNRLNHLVAALETVQEKLAGQSKIDRSLAAALYGLGAHLDSQVSNWQSRGKQWPDYFVDEALPNILELTESIFDDS